MKGNKEKLTEEEEKSEETGEMYYEVTDCDLAVENREMKRWDTFEKKNKAP